jgi:hypothetical protein
MKRTWIFLFLLAALLAGYFLWEAYQRPVATLHQSKPEVEVTAIQLMADYLQDETRANERYLDKVILVSGQLQEKNLNDDIGSLYLDAGGQNMGMINCQLEKGEEKKAEALTIGQTLTLKGRCTGFTIMDVVLTQCLIEQ